MKNKRKVFLALLLTFCCLLAACVAQQPQPDAQIEPDALIEPSVPTQPDDPQIIDGDSSDETGAPDEPDEPADAPDDEVALTVPDEGYSESWTGTVLEVYTEGGGDDSAQVVKVQSGEETVYFTLEQSSTCVRSASGGEEESMVPSELVPGAQVEIEGRSFVGSGYHPISVIRVLEDEKPVIAGPVSVQPVADSPAPVSETDLASLSEPPALTVINGSMRIEALRGGYEWRQKEDDGTVTSVIADCAHPLDMQELVPALPCQPARAGELDAHTAYLCFAVLPDKITVRCWSTDCWGDNGAESSTVFVTKAGSELALDDAFAGAYRIPITENDCVYEVRATWNGDDSCGGSATYSFYTRWPDAEIILPRVEVYDK